MTAPELLAACHAAGIVIRADGDALAVDTPRGKLTPELRAELARRKGELLRLLQASDHSITLKNGLSIPIEALRVGWDLERRGFSLRADDNGALTVTPIRALTAKDRAAIARWRLHLIAILAGEPRA